MPIRIAFLNQKGGVGKSTCSALIGAGLQVAGYRVVFEDLDPQGSLGMWATHVGKLPLLGQVEDPDVVITDTPGRIDLGRDGRGGILGDVLARSDRLVIVAEKSLFSTQATIPMIELVKRVKAPSARGMLLFNKVRPKTVVGEQDEDEMARDLGLPCLINSLPLASAFENVQMMGFAAVKGRNRERVFTLALEILRPGSSAPPQEVADQPAPGDAGATGAA